MDFFTADAHFNDTEVMTLANRPFKTKEQMAERIIKNWNSRVKDSDTVFHIGDFQHKDNGSSIGVINEYIVKRLNGKLILIRGNHDKNNGVKTCIENITIFLGGKTILLQHIPPNSLKEIPRNIDMVLCGHVHKAWKHKNGTVPYINVGMDQWNFMPITITDILKYMAKNRI